MSTMRPGVCKRCLIHGINYPMMMSICPVKGCGEDLVAAEGEPDEDWREQSASCGPTKFPAGRKPEAVKVFEWRLLSLLDAGIRLDPARTLAKSSADLHKVCDAARAGCPDKLAVEIFT